MRQIKIVDGYVSKYSCYMCIPNWYCDLRQQPLWDLAYPTEKLKVSRLHRPLVVGVLPNESTGTILGATFRHCSTEYPHPMFTPAPPSNLPAVLGILLDFSDCIQGKSDIILHMLLAFADDLSRQTATCKGLLLSAKVSLRSTHTLTLS